MLSVVPHGHTDAFNLLQYWKLNPDDYSGHPFGLVWDQRPVHRPPPALPLNSGIEGLNFVRRKSGGKTEAL